MPCWQCLPEFLDNTKYQNPADATHTAFQLGHHINEPAWVWAMSQPQRVQNFNLWMTATHEGKKSWLDVFPPEKFCQNSSEDTILFVDIGGGLGHQCAALKERLSESHVRGRVVLQDQPMAIEHALPLEGVDKMIFDFWTEQPVKGTTLKSPIHMYLELINPAKRCKSVLPSQHHPRLSGREMYPASPKYDRSDGPRLADSNRRHASSRSGSALARCAAGFDHDVESGFHGTDQETMVYFARVGRIGDTGDPPVHWGDTRQSHCSRAKVVS